MADTIAQPTLHDDCSHHVGSRVRVSSASPYHTEWPDTYVIVMIELEYQTRDGINIAIASDEDIAKRRGWTDGWSPDELILEPSP